MDLKSEIEIMNEIKHIPFKISVRYSHNNEYSLMILKKKLRNTSILIEEIPINGV